MMTKDQKGISLLELLVILGMLSGIGLVSMSLTKMSSRSIVQHNVDTDALQITNEIARSLSDPARCLLDLGGQNALSSSTTAITNIKSKFYTIAAQPTAAYGLSNLQIDHYQIQATASEVASEKISYLVIYFINKSIIKKTASATHFTKKIKMSITVDATNAITSCRVVDKNNGEAYWSRDNGVDIYYNTGNVGIGTSSPMSLLDIEGPLLSVAAPPTSLIVTGKTNIIGEGAPISLTAGSGSSGTGGYIKLFGGKQAAGGSLDIHAGLNGGGGPGAVNIIGASGGGAGNQDGGNVFINGGAGVSPGLNGNVILANSQGKVGIKTTTPADEAILSINGPIEIPGTTPLIIGKTNGNTRGNSSIDIQTNRTLGTQVAAVTPWSKAIAIGSSNRSEGDTSVAIGSLNNAASGWPVSAAIGNNNFLKGSWNYVLGNNNNSASTYDNATFLGFNNTLTYHHGYFVGNGNTTSGCCNTHFYSIGNTNRLIASQTYAIGFGITNTVQKSVQIGMSDLAKMIVVDVSPIVVAPTPTPPPDIRVGIGTTAPSQKLSVVGDIQTSGCYYYSGGITGTCASDQRLKKDIHPFNLGLEELLGIKPVQYKYNGLGGFEADNKTQTGLIAQQLEKAAPTLVKSKKIKLHLNDKKDTTIKAVNYHALTYVIINALKSFYHHYISANQEFNRSIATLKNEILKTKKEILFLKEQNAKKRARIEQIKQRLSKKSS